MVNKSRQQTQGVKARKAKARAKASTEHGSYKRRVAERRSAEARKHRLPSLGSLHAGVAHSLIYHSSPVQDRYLSDDLMDRLFGGLTVIKE